MSELKEHIFCDIDEVFPRGYCGPLPSHEARPYYLKSEADKVIAELKESVKGLILDNYLKDKELRHHKFKRCLDTANYWVAVSYQCIDDKHRQRAEKHHYEWLKIAEKFKEA